MDNDIYNIKEQDDRVIVILNWEEIYNKKWELYEWLEFILKKHWVKYIIKSRESRCWDWCCDYYWVTLLYKDEEIDYSHFLGNEQEIYEYMLEDNNILFNYND